MKSVNLFGGLKRAAALTGATFAIAAVFATTAPETAYAAGDATTKKYHKHPKEGHFAHEGLFGSYDQSQLQRGFQVFQNVCSGCHSLKYVAFRNFEALGYSPEQVKALAAQYEVEDGPNDDGEMYMRPAKPSDYWPNPFANEQEARLANGGALPPDLSLMTRARHEGSNYVYSLLQGYEEEVPEELDEPPIGQYFNPYYKTLYLAMAQPLYEDGVEYADGTPATVKQMSKDVAAFLTWTAAPHKDKRKSIGIKTLLFVSVLAGLSYMSYRKIWKPVKEGKNIMEDQA
ncbi:MAG: cytochrome c1 [Pseudomonadota bacterium]